MRRHHLRESIYYFKLVFCISSLFILLSACGVVSTTSEPATLSPTVELSEAISTLSLPTFTPILPTPTLNQPTNTIPLPTLTPKPSETPDVTPLPETTPTLQVTETSERLPTPTNEPASTSEATEVNEAEKSATIDAESSVSITPPSEIAGTPTSTIILPTFTPKPDDTSVPLPTQTAPIPTRTLTATPTEIPLVVTTTSTNTPVVPTVQPTDVPIIATMIPTDVPSVATTLPTNVPIEPTPNPVAPDTNENPPDTLFTALPFDLFTALPTLEDIDYNQIKPAQPVQYWELRFAFPGEPSTVIGSAGSREGIDAAVLAEFDALAIDRGFDVECLPAYCFKYVVSISDNTMQTWQTVEELELFLGPIDHPEEAILLVAAHEYDWSSEAGKETGSFRAVADGYEFVVLKLVDHCDPVQTDRFLLNVTTSGVLTIQHSSIWTQYMGMCI